MPENYLKGSECSTAAFLYQFGLAQCCPSFPSCPILFQQYSRFLKEARKQELGLDFHTSHKWQLQGKHKMLRLQSVPFFLLKRLFPYSHRVNLKEKHKKGIFSSQDFFGIVQQMCLCCTMEMESFITFFSIFLLQYIYCCNWTVACYLTVFFPRTMLISNIQMFYKIITR